MYESPTIIAFMLAEIDRSFLERTFKVPCRKAKILQPAEQSNDDTPSIPNENINSDKITTPTVPAKSFQTPLACNRRCGKFSHPALKRYNARRTLASPCLKPKVVVQQDNHYYVDHYLPSRPLRQQLQSRQIINLPCYAPAVLKRINAVSCGWSRNQKKTHLGLA